MEDLNERVVRRGRVETAAWVLLAVSGLAFVSSLVAASAWDGEPAPEFLIPTSEQIGMAVLGFICLVSFVVGVVLLLVSTTNTVGHDADHADEVLRRELDLERDRWQLDTWRLRC